MKKLFLLLLLPLVLQAQDFKNAKEIYVGNYNGVDFYMRYEVKKENPKKFKTEYSYIAYWVNNSDKDIFYDGSQSFGQLQTKGSKSHNFDIRGEVTDVKDQYVFKAGKRYSTFFFDRWFENPLLPELFFVPNDKARLK